MTLDSLVDAMGACYDLTQPTNGPLNAKWTPQCGSFATNPDNITAAVNEAHAKLYEGYINGAGAPLTAMFVRKKKVADSSKAAAAEKSAALAVDTKRIGDSYNTEKATYDSIAADLTKLVQSYQSTLVISQSVVNSYAAWQRGLFVEKSSTLHDWSDDLYKYAGKTGSTPVVGDLDSVRSQFAAPQTGATFVVKDAIQALKDRSATQAKIMKNAQALCRVYYCELAVKDKLVGKSSFQDTCDFQSSPLCPQWGTSLSAGGTSFTPASFCTDAGFAGPETLGMSKAAGQQCWAAQ
jgi:hypothetical protein